MKLLTIATTTLALAAALAQARTMDKKSLTIDGARKAIAGAVQQAHKSGAAGVIAVVDDGGNLMAVERLDGTFAAGANIAIGKARTAALFKKPTKFFEDVIGKGRTAMVAVNDFTPLQGGIPIVIDGQVVGAVGVSGANSAAQDEEFAMAAVNAVTNVNDRVTYFEASKVSAAFEKGAVLFDGSEKYMVHASHRDKAGMVEVHDQDADIVYVLEGTATFVTGGKLADGKVIAPGEVRGSQIAGDRETRQLSKGDVVIVPAGVPHWFKEVSSPFNYYVVKAR